MGCGYAGYKHCLIGILAIGCIMYIFIGHDALATALTSIQWRSKFGKITGIYTSSNETRNGESGSMLNPITAAFLFDSPHHAVHPNERIDQIVSEAFATDTTFTTTRTATSLIKHHKNFANITTMTPHSQHRICFVTLGGLGNSMFQYAAVVGLTQAKHMRPMIHTQDNVYKAFNVTSESFETTEACTKFRFYGERSCCTFNNITSAVTGENDINLGGYRQSWMYFQKFENEVRREFTFRKEVADKAVLTLENEIKHQLGLNNSMADGNVTISKNKMKIQLSLNYSRINVTLVGIHVRRGDIAYSDQFIKYGYLVPPVEYFHRTMNVFHLKYSDVVFVVCSDDLKWSRENLSAQNVVFISPTSAAIDMAILTLCHHTIMSVGTYGWWAAFLTGGTVIYYAKPARENSPLSREHSKDMHEYYYPHWIKVV